MIVCYFCGQQKIFTCIKIIFRLQKGKICTFLNNTAYRKNFSSQGSVFLAGKWAKRKVLIFSRTAKFPEIAGGFITNFSVKGFLFLICSRVNLYFVKSSSSSMNNTLSDCLWYCISTSSQPIYCFDNLLILFLYFSI